MNQDNDKLEAREVDPQVSAHYEKLADEKTPADLDQAVLREAARAVRADNRKGSFGAWFRPVAFMATVGLSLAIILDLSDTSIFSPPADLSIDAAPPAPTLAPTETAVDAVQKNRAQSTVSEMKRQKRSVSAQSLTVDAPDNGSDDAGVSKTRAAATEPLQPDRETAQYIQSEPDAEFRQSQVLDTVASVANIDVQVTKLQCFKEEKVDPELWWECIESLHQSGMNEFADMELENLRKAFPDFEPPE